MFGQALRLLYAGRGSACLSLRPMTVPSLPIRFPTPNALLTLLLFGLSLVCLELPSEAENSEPSSSAIEAAATKEVPVPHIPEPLLFDLMRPLHAKKGELEVNTLGTIGHGGKLHWAPEVEYAVADGVAIEFEFPFVNSHYESTKLGLQFRMGHDQKAVHGIQLLTEIDAGGDPQTALSALYLFGYRFNEKWSLMSMTGAQAVVGGSAPDEWRGLQNLSLFHDTTDCLTSGIELNWSFTGRELVEEFKVTPQLHWSFSESSMVQLGAGIQKSQGDRWTPQYALRLIRQL